MLLIQNLIADSKTRNQQTKSIVTTSTDMDTGDTQPPDKDNSLRGANSNKSPKQADTQLLGVTQEPMIVTETVDLPQKGDTEMSSETETVTSKEDRNATAKAQAKRLKAQIEQRAKATPAKSVTPEKESIASRTRLKSREQTESPVKAPVEMEDLTQENPESGVEMETIDENLKVQQTRKGASKTKTSQSQSKTRKTALKSERETLKTKTKSKSRKSCNACNGRKFKVNTFDTKNGHYHNAN